MTDKRSEPHSSPWFEELMLRNFHMAAHTGAIIRPYWKPLPTVPGGLTLHWSDPWGNGDLYETTEGHWFVWKGSLGDYPKLGKPWATAISHTEARIWLRRARQRQRDRKGSR